jgi:hypothetical protein
MYFNGITSRRRLLASLKIMEDKALEPIIKDLSDSSLVTAIEENLFAMFPLFSEWSQAEVYDSPEILELITEIPFPLFNGVLRPRLSRRPWMTLSMLQSLAAS